MALAEFNGYQHSEEQIEKIAKHKLYPGGIDEDELKVQVNTDGIKPFITTETLLWRARRSALETNSGSESSGNNQ